MSDTHNKQGVKQCPLCKTLRPEWCKNFQEYEGHPTLIGIPVCLYCGDVITDYMNKLRED